MFVCVLPLCACRLRVSADKSVGTGGGKQVCTDYGESKQFLIVCVTFGQLQEVLLLLFARKFIFIQVCVKNVSSALTRQLASE